MPMIPALSYQFWTDPYKKFHSDGKKFWQFFGLVDFLFGRILGRMKTEGFSEETKNGYDKHADGKGDPI